ncbi:MAG: alpha/beta hydrolase [Deltaproteobacteria bacterium]|nr:alpha/beta hydrolase [Deltaproteobacteria bacterium]
MPEGLVLPEDLLFEERIPFTTGASERALCALRRPDLPAGAPAVVYLHGGAWRWGDRFSRLLDRQAPLARAGFATFSASYTLTPEACFPAQIHDAKAAIRYLRANAGALGVDPDRIGVFGSSAGGHLACLLGTSIGVAELEGERGSPGASSAVQAVCALFPPTCFETMDTFPEGVVPELEHRSAASPEGGLLGGPLEERATNARLASPLTWIRPGAPPFLLLHGRGDPVVPFGQSEQLVEGLRAEGNAVDLIAADDLGHGGDGWARYLPEVIAFFTTHLGRA